MGFRLSTRAYVDALDFAVVFKRWREHFAFQPQEHRGLKVPAAFCSRAVQRALKYWIKNYLPARKLAVEYGTQFDPALKFVSLVEPRPKPVKGVYSKTYFGRRFQDDAYRSIFGVDIRTHDLGATRHTIELWRAAGGSGDNVSIMNAWLSVGRKDEVLSYADPVERVPALLWMARSLLDEAGAPLF